MTNAGDSQGQALTPREREVLERAARGLRNRQIGEALGIAEQTVKNHLSSAMRKLSLHDRTHAVVFAIGNGLIGLPAPDLADALPDGPVQATDARVRSDKLRAAGDLSAHTDGPVAN